MASLWEQLTRVLPSVLPRDPRKAINGTELMDRVTRRLDGDYAENTLRAHFSRMAAEPNSVIAKVEGGHGYYLRPESDAPLLGDQLDALLPLVLPRSPADAVNGTKLIELLAPKLKGHWSESALRTRFSRLADDPNSVLAKVRDGHGYYLVAHRAKGAQRTPGLGVSVRVSASENDDLSDEATVPGSLLVAVRQEFMRIVPRGHESAVPTRLVLSCLRDSLGPGANKNSISTYFHQILKDHAGGVRRTSDGLVYLEEQTPRPKRGLPNAAPPAKRRSPDSVQSRPDDQSPTAPEWAPQHLAPPPKPILLTNVVAVSTVISSRAPREPALNDSAPLHLHEIQGLSEHELEVLQVLSQTGTARVSELAPRLGRRPNRVNGLMLTLRRKLYDLGVVLFTSEVLPNGETMYRFQSRGPR